MMTSRTRACLLTGSVALAVLLMSPATRAQAPAGRGEGPPPAGRAGGQGGGLGQADPWPGQKKVLALADVQTGFHHDSISHALATVEQIGRRSGAYVTMIRTDSQLVTKSQIAGQGRYEGRASVNARTLDFYDAIFMLPSGFGTMSDQQKKDLLAFVHDEGKGLVVGHATGVAFTNWPEFGEMVGGYMDSEFNAEATVIVEDPKFPGASAFGGATFLFNDQHPVFKEYSRDKVRVVLRLDPSSLSEANRARRPDGDFPVAFAKQYGKGRVFNMGWGHPDTTWDNPRFQAFMLEAIKWAIGGTPADLTARPLPAAAR